MGNNTRNKKSKSNVNLPIKDNAAFQLFCGRDIVNKMARARPYQDRRFSL